MTIMPVVDLPQVKDNKPLKSGETIYYAITDGYGNFSWVTFKRNPPSLKCIGKSEGYCDFSTITMLYPSGKNGGIHAMSVEISQKCRGKATCPKISNKKSGKGHKRDTR
jgi:hypothetical protein